MITQLSSRIPGFYKLPLPERAARVAAWAGLTPDEQNVLLGLSGLNAEQASNMIENGIGVYALPLGIATNFLINGQDYLIPMVIEEPSVVAAVSNAAKLFREGGGFTTSSDEAVMIGQIQVVDIADVDAAAAAVMAQRDLLMAEADKVGGSIVRHGGGARGIEVRPFPDTPIGPMLVVHLLYDTRDAMGANAINTAVEHLASPIEAITGGRVNLRILSNLTDQRKARA
ncbi:MAG: 3-hydroxy-3-methylglutaryl-CoA reductase, partial [Anaerolineae bacterium]|nr:3-hydroxy-3-methylglutaryl-CoA reductase [Anaerolineae bacterium]